MRVLLLAGAALVLAACGEPRLGLGGDPSFGLSCRGCVVEDAPHPDAKISALVDMGEVAVGEDVTSKITVVNTGSLSVDVEEIRDDLSPFATDLSCGSKCGRRTIPVGGILDIGFAFHAVSQDRVSKSVMFQSSSGPIYVHLKANSPADDVACSPTGLGFGVLVKGTSLTRTITCQNHSDRDAVVVVEPITDDSGQFSLSEGRLSIGALGSGVVPVTFSARSRGPTYGFIHLDYADGSLLLEVLATGIVTDGGEP